MTDLTTPLRSNRAPSRILTPREAATIKKRIRMGEFLNRIASDYDVNPGRISEIKTGKRFAEVQPAP